MSYFKILKNGAANAVSSYKLILTIWISILVLIIAVAYPLRSFLNSLFGNSMAVERLKDGFDLELTGDLGRMFGGLMTSMTIGVLLLVLVGFLLLTFFAGGLFRRYTLDWGGITVPDFFKASADNFIPFLKIAIEMAVLIAAYTFIIIGIPAIVIQATGGASESGSSIMYLFYAVWFIGMPALLFVADYSRRWIAATGSGRSFRALGNGFRALKKRFWLSYGTELFIILVNVALIVPIIWFPTVATPSKGILVFLFFIGTQMLFILRLMMKAWRYATICELAKY